MNRIVSPQESVTPEAQETGCNAHSSMPHSYFPTFQSGKTLVDCVNSNPIKGTCVGPSLVANRWLVLWAQLLRAERDAGEEVTCLRWKGIRRGRSFSLLFGVCCGTSGYRSGMYTFPVTCLFLLTDLLLHGERLYMGKNQVTKEWEKTRRSRANGFDDKEEKIE